MSAYKLTKQYMTELEKNYKVKERSEKDIETYGSIDNAIENLSKELEEFESLWSKYSSDCLGHGITCNRLKINYLKRLRDV